MNKLNQINFNINGLGQDCSNSTSLGNSTAIKVEWLQSYTKSFPDNKIHGTSMGPIWGRQDPAGPHVGPTNLAIWDCNDLQMS